MTGRVQLQEAFKLALSMALYYWLALWMDWDMPKYGGLAIILIALGTTGASLRKGVLRVIGTTFGLVVGMLTLSLFAQDRWLTLIFLSAYLVFIGYFMQGSQNTYAWFVAGFLPPLVWATTYGVVDNAFHYASFRYLTTTAGIIIYTILLALLWPRNAGDALNRQGTETWAGLRQLFGMYRGHLEDGRLPSEAAALRAKLAGGMAQMATTLQAARSDTPAVIARRRSWNTLRVNMRAFTDALELWRLGIDDCRRIDLDSALPRLAGVVDTIDRRLARIIELWEARCADSEAPVSGDDDAALLEVTAAAHDPPVTDLPHFDRAALLGFVRQLGAIDTASREILRTMRVLCDLAPERVLDDRSGAPDLFPDSRWDPQRLITAFIPALCFVTAFIFWIFFDPPTGPSVPSMAGIFGLMVVMTPMNAMKLLPPFFVGLWVAVAPVYFWVMPRLDTGAGLLGLIFAYTFLVALIWGHKPLLKLVAIALFVMMANISNDQVYSFMGLVNGAFMLFLPMVIVAVVQMLIGPVRPEHVMLHGLRRFFRGCAGITATFARHRPEDAASGRALRRRYERSIVLPAPRQLQAVEKRLEYALFPDNSPDKVQRLLSAMQSVALRLQALDLAHARMVRRSVDWAEPVVELGRGVREHVHRIFERWSRLEPADALNERDALRQLGRGLEEHLDAEAVHRGDGRLDDESLADLYAMLGCARGLVQAVAETDGAVSAIDWDQWAEARF
jgi:uncharacterized membrane protein YccC